MRYDIVMVTYNSMKWLPGCVRALAGADYPLSELHLIFSDNASTDETVHELNQMKAQHPEFGRFTILENGKNLGFGTACNRGAEQGDAPFVFFLNLDTEVDPQVFRQLDEAQKLHPDCGALECRQLPYEMGHHIDPVTMETAWASGAAVAVRRTVLERIGGFDENLFMYCEDVDLSWRIRAAGMPIYYVPSALVHHFVLNRENNQASELREYAGSSIGRLLLSYKYGGFRAQLRANREYLRILRHPKHFDHVRKVLLKQYLEHFGKIHKFTSWKRKNEELYKCAVSPEIDALHHLETEFEAERGRAVLENPLTEGPMISVIVRTCSRPQSLRKTLQSLRWQTYRNFEVLVMEDGQDTARKMIETEFSDLPIRYHATGVNVGRGKNGNTGLELAKGEWLNFLDDDDYFYPDHLELMAAQAAAHPENDLVLGCAMVMKVRMKDKKTWDYERLDLHTMLFERVDRFTMSQTCQIPIQSAIFRKSLFEKCGGLCEDIEGNEDWFMWLKYIENGKRNDPHHVDIYRATSIFVLPGDESEAQERIEKYKVYNRTFYADERLHFDVSLSDMRRYYDNMIADLRCLEQRGELHEFLEQQAKRND